MMSEKRAIVPCCIGTGVDNTTFGICRSSFAVAGSVPRWTIGHLSETTHIVTGLRQNSLASLLMLWLSTPNQTFLKNDLYSRPLLILNEKFGVKTVPAFLKYTTGFTAIGITFLAAGYFFGTLDRPTFYMQRYSNVSFSALRSSGESRDLN